jgi:pyruvate-formate lyase-activating enzyme
MSAEEMNELIYNQYPRKVGKIAALKSIEKAARWISKKDSVDPIEARRRLYKAVQKYAASPATKALDKELVPHCATFMNQGRYLDEPETAASSEAKIRKPDQSQVKWFAYLEAVKLERNL